MFCLREAFSYLSTKVKFTLNRIALEKILSSHLYEYMNYSIITCLDDFTTLLMCICLTYFDEIEIKIIQTVWRDGQTNI